jgi:short-subunit dehydrogenase
LAYNPSAMCSHVIIDSALDTGGLLRESYRDAGKVKKRTLANLSDWSAARLDALRLALRGELKPHGITVSVLCPPDTDTAGFKTENLTKPEETRAISAAAKVLSPGAVADELLRGMARETFLIIPGLDSRMSALAKRLVPGVVYWVMDRAVGKVRS